MSGLLGGQDIAILVSALTDSESVDYKSLKCEVGVGQGGCGRAQKTQIHRGEREKRVSATDFWVMSSCVPGQL